MTLHADISVELGSFVLAVMLSARTRGLIFYRTVYFLPHVAAAVAVCVVWIFVLQPDRGLINQALRPLLDWIEGGPQTCPDCDRTYRGALTYSTDTCSELLGESLPVDAIYGFVFLDEYNRELWAPDTTTGKWYFIERLTSDNGRQWLINGSDAIIMDPEDCDNGNQNLGTLTITLTWVDR